MAERYGVRKGLRVRDLEGHDLGRVTRCDEWGFEVEKGFPILFRQDLVARYDEVRHVRDGVVTLARTSHDLLDLAAGGMPISWRVPTPPEFPAAATPAEARGVFADLAGAPPAEAGVPAAPPLSPDQALTRADEREYEATHGEGVPDVSAPSHR